MIVLIILAFELLVEMIGIEPVLSTIVTFTILTVTSPTKIPLPCASAKLLLITQLLIVD